MTFRERLGIAIRNAAPDENKSGWRDEQAELLGVGERTFADWYYGKAAPDAENLIRLMGHFGPAFIDMVLEPTGYRVASADEAADMDRSRENLEMAVNAIAAELARLNGGNK